MTQTDLKLHHWNRDFVWEDHSSASIKLSLDQVRAFDEDGFVVVTDAFSPSDLQPVLDELDAYERKSQEWLEGKGGSVGISDKDAITFTPNLVKRSEVLNAFSRHPAILGFCRDLIGDDVNMYWDQAVYKKPEKPRRFPWHQDNGYKFVIPQAYLTCWIPLVDATEANGCPQVAAGVHRLGTLAHTYVDPLGFECFSQPPEGTKRIAEAPKGSVVIFSSLTPHLTGPNTTKDVRKAYILQYAPEGAYALEGDVDAPKQTMQDDPSYQYPVLRGGEAV